MSKPNPALSDILDGFTLLASHGGLVEVRALKVPDRRNPSFTSTWSGYFDEAHHFQAVRAIAEHLDGLAPAVYVTANPVAPALLARASNRLAGRATMTTGDADIEQRRWFLLDVDPVRPAGISSTEAELRAALECRDTVVKFLAELGFPEPVQAMSGNGAHAMWAIDEPNTNEIRDLVQRGLRALAARFSSPLVTVDEAVFNAARIWKLPGTLACKGDPTEDRPHRRAAIESRPDDLIMVPHDGLLALAEMAPAPARPLVGGARPVTGPREAIDFVAAFTARWWYKRALRDGKHAVQCPWVSEHSQDSGLTETCLFEPKAAGDPWGFDCRHSHCTDRTIKDVISTLDLSPARSMTPASREMPPSQPKADAHPRRSAAIAMPDLVDRYLAEAADAQNRRLPFNIPAFDREYRGLDRGDVVVLLGSLGVGKTGFGINLLERITGPAKVPGLIASLEMPATQVLERFASFTLTKSGRDLYEMATRRDPWVVHAMQRDVAAAWSQVRVLESAMTIQGLDTEIGLAKAEPPGVRVVLVDYLGLLATGRGGSPYGEISAIAREMKKLAKRHGVAILLLCQTNRTSDAGTPVTIHMARDSGAIGESVDMAFGLWRPALAKEATPEDQVRWANYLMVKNLKNRHGEQYQTFRLDWRPSVWHIENAVRIDPNTLEPMTSPEPGGASSELPF